ncbi:hypothetical protein BpHYR1_024407 [Brachionus plicatilis]|uniref:Uncharacterized protein n=1 Tax=Brachionus plicatilis TaxID=10195 RepID=A0A3M7QWW6_BRAPC|nr:hypothetical protein BpHYR1_024407 [Brachionus plicatilis]
MSTHVTVQTNTPNKIKDFFDCFTRELTVIQFLYFCNQFEITKLLIIIMLTNEITKNIFYFNSTIQLSESIGVTEGVKQGGIGACINGLNLSLIPYCDDIIIISPFYGHTLNECFGFSKKWKVNFNPDKSACLTLNPASSKFQDKFIINGIHIPNVDGFDKFNSLIMYTKKYSGYFKNYIAQMQRPRPKTEPSAAPNRANRTNCTNYHEL